MKRIEYIDLAKGICILLVVINHISIGGYFSDGNYPMSDIFNQMRMPLYFILSGLFFKDYAGGIREFLLRKTNRILVPYLFFMILYTASARIVHIITGIDTSTPDIAGIWSPLWFLRCLFFMNVIFAVFFYAIKHLHLNEPYPDVLLGTCIMGIGIAGYFVGNLHLNFGTSMTCMPFLWAGYVLNRRLNMLGRKIPGAWALVFTLVLLVMVHYMYMGDNYFFSNTYSSTLPLLYASGLFGTLAVLLLSSVIKWLPVISYIGRYSIIVLCTHMAVMKVFLALKKLLPVSNLSNFWQSNTVQSWTILIFTIAGCMFSCWFLSKYLPWFTAQKDLIKNS